MFVFPGNKNETVLQLVKKKANRIARSFLFKMLQVVNAFFLHLLADSISNFKTIIPFSYDILQKCVVSL